MKNLELKAVLPLGVLSLLLFAVGVWKAAPVFITIASGGAMIVLAALGVTAYRASRHLGALVLAVTGIWLLVGPSVMRGVFHGALEDKLLTPSQATQSSSVVTYGLLVIVALLFRITKPKKVE